MRVIAGEAKGFHLRGPAGSFTRPMADKIKGALFSMLAALHVEPQRVVDLYAGTGSVGIEALSRGAEHADFVEQNAAAAEVVRANLAHTKFADRATVHHTNVMAYLRYAEQRPEHGSALPVADLVIMDPPYADPEIPVVLRKVGMSPLVQSGSVVAIGHSPRVTLADETGRLRRVKERCHGDSCFSVYEVVDEVVDDHPQSLHKAEQDATGDLPGKLRPDHVRSPGRRAEGSEAVRRGGGGRVRGGRQAWRTLLDE